jgi:glycerol dehydrogenase
MESTTIAAFASPGRYVQGRGAIRSLKGVLENLGSRRPLVLQDAAVAGMVSGLLDDLPGAIRVDFGGECSQGEIARVSRLSREAGADAVVGIGGGKALDTAKAAAHPGRLEVVLAPTIASTDAPTSSLAVVYDEEGKFAELRLLGRNPDAVIVDTDLIAKAPVRFLVAGMGDGLSTYFEAETSSRGGGRTVAGGVSTQAALALARLCYGILLEHSPSARLACERDAATPALEKVVEANTLLSGLGFESGGLAAAHSIHNGLTVLPETHHSLHGEKVAFGTIAMLVLEGRPATLLEEVVDFCLVVGLPVSLAEIGLDGAGRKDLRAVSVAACAPHENMHNEPFDVRPEMVTDAILAADAFGRKRRLERASQGPAERDAQHNDHLRDLAASRPGKERDR